MCYLRKMSILYVMNLLVVPHMVEYMAHYYIYFTLKTYVTLLISLTLYDLQAIRQLLVHTETLTYCIDKEI